MDIIIKLDGNDNKKINSKTFYKMAFVWNALEDGWSVKKKQDSFVFYKNHEGKKEIFTDEYITTFMKDNFDINKFLE